MDTEDRKQDSQHDHDYDKPHDNHHRGLEHPYQGVRQAFDFALLKPGHLAQHRVQFATRLATCDHVQEHGREVPA